MRQKGFTLIELMIVIAIIGILSMFALMMYQDYAKRVYISEGLSLSMPAKTAITESFSDRGEWVFDNASAGLPSGANIRGQAISGIFVSGGPAAFPSITASSSMVSNVHIFYNQKVDSRASSIPTQPANGSTTGDNAIVIAPVAASIKGSVQWACVRHGNNILKKWLPANCRSEIP